MIFFFLLLFLYILQLFYSLHYTSFPFLKGCRLEKGHIVLVLFPFIKKKKKKIYATFVKGLGDKYLCLMRLADTGSFPGILAKWFLILLSFYPCLCLNL